jgi:hypothetical protein
MRRAILIAILVTGMRAHAGADEPLQLHANALAASTPGTEAGILTLEMDDREKSWLRAEAMVWLGAGTESEADAMVIVVRAIDPRGRGELKLGRFVEVAGAVRPVHLDGFDARVRLPWRSALETFGGVPVQPELGAHAWDWVGGGRASRQLGDWGNVGVAYLQRRSEGRLDASEIGVDGGGALGARLDAGARVSWDLIDPGVADAHASIAARLGRAWRIEAFASHVSPSRVLPATSLFTVLGDSPSERAGAEARWRAAPRLDVTAAAGVRHTGGQTGPTARLAATLRLDDRGDQSIIAELRRDGIGDDAWTGAHVAGRIALPRKLSLACEGELVVPDRQGAGRGAVWPWGLVALGWRPAPRWDVAAAIEARSSPEDRWRIDGIVRLTRAWGGP